MRLRPAIYHKNYFLVGNGDFDRKQLVSEAEAFSFSRWLWWSHVKFPKTIGFLKLSCWILPVFVTRILKSKDVHLPEKLTSGCRIDQEKIHGRGYANFRTPLHSNTEYASLYMCNSRLLPVHTIPCNQKKEQLCLSLKTSI